MNSGKSLSVKFFYQQSKCFLMISHLSALYIIHIILQSIYVFCLFFCVQLIPLQIGNCPSDPGPVGKSRFHRYVMTILKLNAVLCQKISMKLCFCFFSFFLIGNFGSKYHKREHILTELCTLKLKIHTQVVLQIYEFI